MRCKLGDVVRTSFLLDGQVVLLLPRGQQAYDWPTRDLLSLRKWFKWTKTLLSSLTTKLLIYVWKAKRESFSQLFHGLIIWHLFPDSNWLCRRTLFRPVLLGNGHLRPLAIHCKHWRSQCRNVGRLGFFQFLVVLYNLHMETSSAWNWGHGQAFTRLFVRCEYLYLIWFGYLSSICALDPWKVRGWICVCVLGEHLTVWCLFYCVFQLDIAYLSGFLLLIIWTIIALFWSSILIPTIAWLHFRNDCSSCYRCRSFKVLIWNVINLLILSAGRSSYLLLWKWYKVLLEACLIWSLLALGWACALMIEINLCQSYALLARGVEYRCVHFYFLSDVLGGVWVCKAFR